MSLTIPTALTALLPLLATAISARLADDGLSQGKNALIAAIAILLTAIACELLGIGLIPGNPAATALAILGYVGVLMQNDFSVLYVYLVAKPSPISPAQPPTPANLNPVRVPTALILPVPANPAVPPRASAQEQGPNG